MSILEVKNLKKVYTTRFSNQQVQALSNVSFSVEEGEYVAIMGESGSGKTTLLNILASLDKPTSGEVLLNGKDITRIKEKEISQFRRKNLGFVFQDFNLLDTLTIGENIVLPLTLDKVSVKEQDERLNEVSTILGIKDLLGKRTFEVSGGQAQRTAIARALINNPSILLADEPTGNLDSKSSKVVMELFQKINKENKVTTMMVTHDPLAASYCSRILFIKDGSIYNEIYKGSSREQFYQEIMDVLTLLGGDN